MKEIVLIDDSRFDLAINEIVITKSLGQKCLKFTNPIEGYEFIKQKLENSDDQILLFLDLNMPELNGWELLDLLRSCPENTLAKINVVIVSNSDNPVDIANAKNYQIVSNYATKPLSEAKLQVLVLDFDNS